MANLILKAEPGGFYWQITGLSSPFHPDHYLYAGIATTPVGDNHYEEPQSRISRVRSWSDNKKKSTNENWVSCAPGDFNFEFVGAKTIRVYGWAQTTGFDQQYWEAGEATVTLTTSLSVEPWSWEKSNGSADKTDTSRAYQILLGKQPVSAGFSHEVWNDLVDKVAEVRSELGLGWYTKTDVYVSAEECKVEPGDTLSAKIYNSVRYQVGSYRGTNITDRVEGGEILGRHITHMVDVLNDIIENP